MQAEASLGALVNGWLDWATWQSTHRDGAEENPHIDAFMEVGFLIEDNPDAAFKFIGLVLGDPRSDAALAALAAGPVEDLLSRHGSIFIERIEAEARSNPRFASLLGGVWQFEMTDEIWARVQNVWDRRGWDGLPK